MPAVFSLPVSTVPINIVQTLSLSTFKEKTPSHVDVRGWPGASQTTDKSLTAKPSKGWNFGEAQALPVPQLWAKR